MGVEVVIVRLLTAEDGPSVGAARSGVVCSGDILSPRAGPPRHMPPADRGAGLTGRMAHPGGRWAVRTVTFVSGRPWADRGRLNAGGWRGVPARAPTR